MSMSVKHHPDASGPGLQHITTSQVRVEFFRYGDRGPGSSPSGRMVFDGRNQESTAPSVVSMTYSHSLGTAGASVTLSVKTPAAWGRVEGSLFDRITPGDWCTIEYLAGDQGAHIFTGRLVGIAPSLGSTTVAGSASSWTLSLTGFGTVWEETKLWYNTFAGESAYAAALSNLQGVNLGGTPLQVITSLLRNFVDSIARSGRIRLTFPQGFPHGENFLDAVKIDAVDYHEDDPARQRQRELVNPALMSIDGISCWAAAKEWGDPAWCELFTDIRPKQRGMRWARVGQTDMVAVFRTRPFPTKFDDVGGSFFASPDRHYLPVEHVRLDLGMSSLERVNAFFVTPSLLLEGRSDVIDLLGPLWDKADVAKYGMHQFAVDSKYAPREGSIFDLGRTLRKLACEWYAMNPFLLNGTLSLPYLEPHIRIGDVVTVSNFEGKPVTLYVEAVQHSWAPRGGKTTLTVTRGWRGSDESYLATLREVTARYTTVTQDAEVVG